MSEPDTKKKRPNRRHWTRRLLVQALYQWRLADTELTALLAEFRTSEDMRSADPDWFADALRSILNDAGPLASQLSVHLDRPWEQIDPVEQGVLLLGAYELTQEFGTPYRVVITEGVELARLFGAQDSHLYINGVLDRIAREARAVEVKAPRS